MNFICNGVNKLALVVSRLVVVLLLLLLVLYVCVCVCVGMYVYVWLIQLPLLLLGAMISSEHMLVVSVPLRWDEMR